MKIAAIFVLLFTLSAAYTAWIDIIRGSRFLTALKHLKSPFAVMSTIEYAIIFFFLSLMILPAANSFLNKRKQALTNKKT